MPLALQRFTPALFDVPSDWRSERRAETVFLTYAYDKYWILGRYGYLFSTG